ncbi:MAG: hypothetical protein JNK59_03320 [Sterolibacteriaceae bacterium]|nr:hypothetical protein [Sterolibacteriaceae bacterium]
MMMARKGDFAKGVPLPSGLDIASIHRSVDYMEKELAEFVDIYHEQANVFSAIVGILGTRALDQLSGYEKHRNIDIAQQRFPDLKRRNSGPNPPPELSLESKGSKRPWAVQSHYNHPGWYIVWRYLVDSTESLEPGKPVIVWRVDVVFLVADDWKYEGSSAGEGKGGRTHTFGVKNPSKKLKGSAVYSRSDVILRQGKPVPSDAGDELS